MKKPQLSSVLVGLGTAACCAFLGYTLIHPARAGAVNPPSAEPTVSRAEATVSDRTPNEESGLPVFGEWQNFTTEDGLPSNKVFSIRIDGKRTWVGTDNGLAWFENGKWKTLSVKDGLPHRAVLSLDISPSTGDLWIGTMGGLARLSAGRLDVMTQLNSGLSNDFVNEVQCDPEEPYLWAATAMGLSRLHVPSATWESYTQENTPMHEPWTYSVAVDRGVVYVGAWGGGILEFQKASQTWREYRDPDKEMEIDLLPNDGPVHDVTSAVDFAGGVLWQSSYMGLARFDGRRWSSYYREDSGLASNFVNFVRSVGTRALLCTDNGLSVTDGQNWITYRRSPQGKGEVYYFEGAERKALKTTSTGLAHNFVQSADLQGDTLWVATQGGVSRARLTDRWSTETLQVKK